MHEPFITTHHRFHQLEVPMPARRACLAQSLGEHIIASAQLSDTELAVLVAEFQQLAQRKQAKAKADANPSAAAQSMQHAQRLAHQRATIAGLLTRNL